MISFCSHNFCDNFSVHLLSHMLYLLFAGHDCSKELDEERLKCQMEMENLRRKLNTSLEQEREVWTEERRELESTLEELKDKIASQPQVAELEGQLSASHVRLENMYATTVIPQRTELTD